MNGSQHTVNPYIYRLLLTFGRIIPSSGCPRLKRVQVRQTSLPQTPTTLHEFLPHSWPEDRRQTSRNRTPKTGALVFYWRSLIQTKSVLLQLFLTSVFRFFRLTVQSFATSRSSGTKRNRSWLNVRRPIFHPLLTPIPITQPVPPTRLVRTNQYPRTT